MAEPALVFDLDGTLIDSTADIAAAVNLVSDELGVPRRTTEEVRSFIGDGAPKLLARHLGTDDEELIARAYTSWRTHYERVCLERTTWFDGVPELLEAIEGRTVAVVSNKPEAFCRRILDGLKASHRFGAIIGGDTFAEKKPSPMPLLGALEQIGGRAQDALMIGDGHQDMRAARAAGIEAIGVLWGHTSEERLRACGATRIADTVQTLTAMLAADA